jgi:1-acyl-sn-glycerol-3-phosphate acyltransferase
MIFLLFVGLAVLLFRFPFLQTTEKALWIQRWSRWVANMLGLHITVEGAIPSSAGLLVVANHTSWLDIVVMNCVHPAAFIAKAEIARWPVVGLLVARSGTLFIERGKRTAVHRVLQDSVERLRSGRSVAVFPEGTTNNGASLLPFHGNMMEAAIRAQVAVQPIGIAYRNRHGALCPSVVFVGATTFVTSLLKVLADSDIHVAVSFLQKIECVGKTRHHLADESREKIASHLGVPLENSIFSHKAS